MKARLAAALGLVFALWWSLAGQSPPAAPPAALVSAVEGFAITVSDMDRAVDFYRRVLASEPVADVEVGGEPYDRLFAVPGARLRIVRMRLGVEMVELTEFRPRGRPVPADSRSHDRWFQHLAIVVSDIEQAHQWLERHRVARISPAPQRLPDWNAAAGGISAFYFKDPDGHPLEIIQFPSDKGDPRWQAPGDRIFRGIDHTAIVVGDTERSLAFYRDTLGLRVAGGSENSGPEQERLNNVAGARLRITTLRAAAGPGIELLEYLTPRDGRAAADVRANDLAHTQTLLVAREPAVAARALARAAGMPQTPVASLDGRAFGVRAAFLARDPDGHAVQVRAR